MDKGFHETDSGTRKGKHRRPSWLILHYTEWNKPLGQIRLQGQSYRQPHGRAVMIFFACETREGALKCVEVIKDEAGTKGGLNISSEKTGIKHLIIASTSLGFNIRHYRDSNTATGWKLLIKP